VSDGGGEYKSTISQGRVPRRENGQDWHRQSYDASIGEFVTHWQKSFSTISIYTDFRPARSRTLEAIMSTTTHHEEALAAVVGQVPGVDELYPAAPVLTTVVKEVVGALTQKPTRPELVAFTESDEGIGAAVAIGISDGAAATDICRQVYDTIEEYFVAAGTPAVTSIKVTVARIG
jgi:hypothetical protein